MARRKFTSAIRQPGFSRKLSLAFGAVILIVALAFPVIFYSFERINDASDHASESAITLKNVSTFQQSLSDVRSAARDFVQSNDDADKKRIIEEISTATDAARCIADLKCEQGMKPGERLPDTEAKEWRKLMTATAGARTRLESNLAGNTGNAVKIFDRDISNKIDKPAQSLTDRITGRGLSAQSTIANSVLQSKAIVTAVLTIALVVAAVLAVMFPRLLMSRLNRARALARRLANGDLEARASDSDARRTDEVGDLIADFNLMAMSLQSRQNENDLLQEQLQIQLTKEQERATRDPLTGLRNHRYFQDSLRAEIERCRRTGGQVSIAVIDLDDFKSVNDRFGHSEGDAVLLRATKCIGDNLRPYDLACRLGGEEFGVIFPEADAAEAKMVLDRIAEIVLGCGPNGERLTFSGGITTFPHHANTQTELYQRADEASYTAKSNGKAATVIYDPSVVSSMNSEDRVKQRSRDAMLTTATTLVSAVDAKDPYTRFHSELVAIYAATIARAMRLDEATVKLVYRAGLLHDVGKIGIPEELLVKDQLTQEEWVQVRLHPEFSYRILQAAEMEPVATWTRHHHEHYDGTGYPMQLSGQNIPIGARIILVADAFETMTSDRIYRRALGVDAALAELRGGSGLQFDPDVVSIMCNLVESGVFQQVMQQYGRTITAGSAPASAPAQQPVVDAPAVAEAPIASPSVGAVTELPPMQAPAQPVTEAPAVSAQSDMDAVIQQISGEDAQVVQGELPPLEKPMAPPADASDEAA